MKIKRYNQFVEQSRLFESLSDSEEFKKNIQNLKLTLKLMFEPIFEKEKLIREFGNIRQIEEGADSLIEIMFDMWYHAIVKREDLDEEFKEEILSDFDEALQKSRQVFIDKSYQLGIESALDILVTNIEEIKKRQDLEDEDWKKPKEISYKDMTNNEINDLINQAIDEEDFERVKFLSKFLESIEITDEVTECVGEFCQKLLEILIKYYYS